MGQIASRENAPSVPAPARGARRLRSVADLRIGDNASFICGSDQEHAAVVCAFVRAGIEQGQRVAYVHDMRAPQAIAAMLREHGIDVDQAQAAGQLLFIPAKQLYARGAGYSFDCVLDKMYAMTALALADGWSALRLTTEMSWLLRQTQGTERLLELGGRMGGFFRDNAALGLGQFERRHFSAAALLDVLLAHPIVVLGSEAVNNLYYTPHVEVSARWRSEATLTRWMSNLKERKRAAENLGELLQVHREILQNLGSGIVVLSRDGYVVQCNPFVERLLGVPSLDLVGRDLAELFPSLAGDDFGGVLQRVLAGEVVLSPDLVVERAGCFPLWLIATLAPYRDDEGQIIGIVAVISDITSRKNMEEALRAGEQQARQTQKIEAVSRLAAGVAHDMNNALNAIIAFADLAAQDIHDVPGGNGGEGADGAGGTEGLAALRADIGEIRTAAERAASITRRLLTFSREQASQLQDVELDAVVRGVETTLRRLVGDHITLDLRLAADAGRVRTDPVQLEQVIINLALNARDAMPEGGGLAIETRVERVAVELPGAMDAIAPGDYTVLRISDGGCGMSAEVLARAFEPFFTTKDSCRRSGLGLPEVYGIVRQSGAKIRVESQIAEGTSVEVFFPGAPQAPGDRVGPAHTVGSETVLLVEDEELVRKVVARVLSRAGYRVHLANGAAEALATCDQLGDTLDLLVTDVVMPGVGGKELAARVATRFPAVKILYMTGYTDDELLRRGILDQGRALILKPFSPEDLLRRIRGILDAD